MIRLPMKDILTQHRDETIRAAIATFNNPKAERIDDLYSNLIGLPKLSSHWRWPGMSPDSARKKLERLLLIRGDIAHRTRHSGFVKRPELDDFVAFTNRLSVKTHNAVASHLNQSARDWNGKRNYGTYGTNGIDGKKQIFSVVSVYSVCSVVSLLVHNVYQSCKDRFSRLNVKESLAQDRACPPQNWLASGAAQASKA
jgi:hypothetical protein